MIGKYKENRAEVLFKDNLNEEILVEVITGLIFKGRLLAISCNTFIIQTKEGLVEMFRYEDVRLLQCRKYEYEKEDN